MKAIRSHTSSLTVATLFSLTFQLHAQHYPAGAEGIRAASLPEPGFTIRDDNSFYYSDKTTGFWNILSDFSEFNYVQTPRLAWVSEWKILEAHYGIAVRIPFAYKEISYSPNYSSSGGLGSFPGQPGSAPTKVTLDRFGLTDMEVEPFMLSWNLKHFDVVLGYSFWAPTGDYDPNVLPFLRLGNGYWTHAIKLGGTWYPDSEKTWALSLLGHYEFNTWQYLQTGPLPGGGVGQQGDTPGDVFTLEWAASKTFAKSINVGLTGYYQQQVTDTTVPSYFVPTYLNQRVDVAGIGPEVGVSVPRWGLAVSLRYAYEFTANDRPQGSLVTLSVRKTF
jgi:hypothetical protein